MRIYIVGFIAIFFLSTSGISVYKHYCSLKGTSLTLFADAPNCCSPHAMMKMKHKAKECKSQHPFNQENASDNCCSFDYLSYPINTNIVNQDIQIHATPLCFVSKKINFKDYTFQFTSEVPPDKTPPVSSMATRLSQIQSYLL